ncbi:MAG: vitamin K epoxide reductase family protein [bacterium]
MRPGLAVPLLKRGLAASGALVAGYLTYAHSSQTTLACAGGRHGCDIVNSSPYATVGGVYVGALGLAGYVALLVMTLVETHSKASLQETLRALFFGAALIGFLYSLYLTAIELFVLRAICQWCVASAVIMTALFFISLLDLRK